MIIDSVMNNIILVQEMALKEGQIKERAAILSIVQDEMSYHNEGTAKGDNPTWDALYRVAMAIGARQKQ